MKKTILYLFAMLFALTGCDKTIHNMDEELPVGKNIVSVSLTTDSVANAPLRDVHLFWFGETDQLYRHDYYPAMEELAKARLTLPTGGYTIVAVLNTGKDLPFMTKSRADTTNMVVSELNQWIRENEGNYPDLLTGTLRYVLQGGVELVYIDLNKKTDGLQTNSVELLMTIPSPRLPDFVSAKAVANPALRGVAHIFKKGETKLLATKRAMLIPTATEGVYKMELSLHEGEYDVNLWVDYAMEANDDNHYITTTDPNIVTILPETAYTANSDIRDAFSKRVSVSVAKGKDVSQKVEMLRPLAKYRLVATDVEKYEQMRVAKGLPAMSDLKVYIGYEGFFPCAYNVKDGKPADAKGGYGYNSAFSEQETNKVTVGKDYVLVNGNQSSVSVTILFKDAAGKTVSGANGVKVEYRAGQLTTVSGNFLTSGIGGSIDINMDWSGDYDVEF